MMRRVNRRLLFALTLISIWFSLIVFVKISEMSLRRGTNDTLVNATAELLSLRELIAMHNERQHIHSAERYGPITRETVLITIQVHNRIAYLRHLVASLKRAKYIERALLIFSHDVYDAAINELIQSIDFCMVMQVFYPHSIQLYPHTFPGTHSSDCPRDVTKSDAIVMNCTNAQHPDTYGHYREAKFTQMKHHWWWKLNRIFDELRVTKDLDDMRLLLLEEDHYVTEDFLYVYKTMQKQAHLDCPRCNVIALGTYEEELTESTYNQIEIAPWTTNLHNMGMALNRTTWRAVKACAEHFCTYDEYNYDFSLQNINRKCLRRKLFTALIRGPRVYHTGECGVHHTHENCDVDEKIAEIDARLAKAKRQRLLYPEDLEISSVDLVQPELTLVNNGGWADRRDHCLCLQMTWRRVADNCVDVR